MGAKRQFHKRLTDIKPYLLAHRIITPQGCWELDNSAAERPTLSVNGIRRSVYQWAALVWLDFNVWNTFGWQINHHCDNPRCWRPKHLFIGTQYDNVRDCVKKGRHVSLPGVGGPALLREWQVRDMRRRRKKGELYRTIGKSHGVTARTVSDICRRKRWSRVP